MVSPEPVLTPEAAGLARAVADRYGGTLADVLRLAIPPRHARAEKAAPEAVANTGADAGETLPPAPAPGPWERYPAGPSFLAALAGGRSPRAVWNALPGPDWPTEIALAAAATAASGRGTLIVVPDRRDLDAVHTALAALPARPSGAGTPGSGPPGGSPPGATAPGAGRRRMTGPGGAPVAAGAGGADPARAGAPGGGPAGVIPHSCLSAELGPAERYRRWLAGRRGTATVVAGTRSAMFAPVHDLGLVVLWDDGDDLHAEPRAPYPHAREVLALRAHRAGAAALIGGFARTAEATQLVSGGWAHPLGADRATVRRFAPASPRPGRTGSWPGTRRPGPPACPAWRCAPSATRWPAAPSCSRCRAAATWPRWPANGAGRQPGARPAAARWRWPAPRPRRVCRWCGRVAPSRVCQHCGHAGLRALVTGAGRTAEELGRAFPSVPVRTSGRSGVLHEVPADPAVVVATPGAEPRAANGYAAAVLLDGWVLLGRPSLRAAEEALRRWMNAAALVQPAAEGGTVVVVADAGLPAVQALIRWDPVTHAERELAERAELRFPPAVRMASLTGAEPAVRDMIAAASLPPYAEVLGPVPVTARPAAPADGRHPAADGQPDLPAPRDAQVRALIRVPRKDGAVLAASLHAAQSLRSARKDTEVIRVQLDPAELI